MMHSKIRRGLLFVLAPVALAFCAYWTPRLHPAAAKDFPRVAKAREVSQQLAERLGMDARRLSMHVTAQNDQARAYLAGHAQPGALLLPYSVVRVQRRERAGGKALRMELGPNIVTNFFFDNGADAAANVDTSAPAPTYSLAAAQSLLATLAPGKWGFQLLRQSEEGGSRTFEWVSTSKPVCNAFLRVESGVPVEFRLRQPVPDELKADMEWQSNIESGQSLISRLLLGGFLLALFSLGVFLFQVRPGERPLQYTVLRFTGLLVFFTLVFEAITNRPNGAAQFALLLAQLAIWILLSCGMVAGDFGARWTGQSHWAWLRAWRNGVDLRNHAGWAVLLGLSGAAILSCLPAIAARYFAGVVWTSRPNYFMQASWLPTLNTMMPHLFVGSALFLTAITVFPLWRQAGRWKWVWRGLGLVLGLASVDTQSIISGNLLVVFVFGLLMVTVGRQVFHEGGALAAFVAVAFCEPLQATLIQSSQAINQGASVFAAAWPGLILFPTMLGIGIWLVTTMPPVNLSEDANLETQEGLFETERKRLDGEFQLARQAQQKLLPAQTPELDSFSISAICQPAREVGGDLYEYAKLPDGRLLLSVADVSGKGLPAALYMTMTKGILLAASQGTSDLRQIAAAVNEHIYRAARRRIFITAVFAVLDPKTGQIEYLRAGHNPAILCKKDAQSVELLPLPGLGLGLASPALFAHHIHTSKLQLTQGDLLVLYSDGITESMNAAGELFGDDRLLDCIRQARGLTAEEMRNQILRAVEKHAAGLEPNDDITLLILEATTSTPQTLN